MLCCFWCLHNPLTWTTVYFTRVCDRFCTRTQTGDPGLQSHPKDFCGVCTESDSGEISGRAQSPARNGHPSTGDLARSCLTLTFESENSCSAPSTLQLTYWNQFDYHNRHPGFRALKHHTGARPTPGALNSSAAPAAAGVILLR